MRCIARHDPRCSERQPSESGAHPVRGGPPSAIRGAHRYGRGRVDLGDGSPQHRHRCGDRVRIVGVSVIADPQQRRQAKAVISHATRTPPAGAAPRQHPSHRPLRSATSRVRGRSLAVSLSYVAASRASGRQIDVNQRGRPGQRHSRRTKSAEDDDTATHSAETRRAHRHCAGVPPSSPAAPPPRLPPSQLQPTRFQFRTSAKPPAPRLGGVILLRPADTPIVCRIVVEDNFGRQRPATNSR